MTVWSKVRLGSMRPHLNKTKQKRGGKGAEDRTGKRRRYSPEECGVGIHSSRLIFAVSNFRCEFKILLASKAKNKLPKALGSVSLHKYLLE